MKGPLFGAVVGAVVVWGAQSIPTDTATGLRAGQEREETVSQAYIIIHEGKVEVWLDLTEADALEFAEEYPDAHVERITVRRRAAGAFEGHRSP